MSENFFPVSHEPSEVKKPLFPVDESKSAGSGALVEFKPTSWLSNSSFPSAIVDDTTPEQTAASPGRSPADDLSSASDDGSSSSSGSKRRRRKKEKKRKTKRKSSKRHRKSEHRHRRHESGEGRSRTDREKIVDIETKLKRLTEVTHKPDLWGETRRGRSQAETGERDDFFVDRHGDENNAVFGKLYRLDIPKYTRAGGNEFLAGSDLPSRVIKEILRPRGAGEPVIQDGVKFKKHDRYFSEKHVLRERDRSAKRIRIVHTRDTDARVARQRGDTHADFLPFPDNDDDDDENAIEGDTFEEVLLKRQREFNEKLRQNPNDIKTWLEFVKFQDEGTALHRRNVAGPILEKKISILEQALNANPDSEALLLEYLSVCQLHLSPDHMLQLWNKIMNKHPTKSRLWKEYIQFRQSQFSSFSVPGCREVFADAIRTLSKIRSDTLQDAYQRQGLQKLPDDIQQLIQVVEATLVDVFVRACAFEMQAGYTERAVGMFQALLEFNLYRPAELRSASLPLVMECFAAFWDCDVPRVGDASAPTWAGWYESLSAGQLQRPEVPPFKPETRNEAHPSLLAWLAAERQTREAVWQPLRDPTGAVLSDISSTSDAGLDSDAMHRVVLIDDIQAFLFDVTQPRALKQLVRSFMMALGLDGRLVGSALWGHKTDTHTPLSNTRLVNLEYFESIPELYSLGNAWAQYGFGPSEPSDTPHTAQADTRTLSDAMRMVHIEPRVVIPAAKAQFIRNVLDSCIRVFPADLTFKCLRVAVELSKGAKAAKKAAKAFLKADSLNLMLLYLYAQVEQRNANFEAAEKVYTQTLWMAGQLPEEEKPRLPLLYLSYVYLIIDRAARDRRNPLQDPHTTQLLVYVLKSCAAHDFVPLQGAPPTSTPTELVRCKRQFTEALESGVYSWNFVSPGQDGDIYELLPTSSKGCFAVCFAWFQYLTEGMEAAQQVYDKFVFPAARKAATRSRWAASQATSYEHAGPQHEWLFLSYVRIVYLHTQYMRAPPKLMRNALGTALSVFPDNPLLLCLLVDQESRTQLTSRLRRHFATASTGGAANEQSVIISLFSAVSEFGRSAGSYRATRVFEQALGNASRSLVGVWRLFMLYHIARSDAENAKRVFYRAIHQCPWSKTLWLDGLTWLEQLGCLNADERVDLLNLMHEKEIRIHDLQFVSADKRLLSDLQSNHTL